MKLVEINRKYEEIIHSQDNSDRKDRRLADLMTEMESAYKIPTIRNEAWEQENRSVIALYRKISLSRSI